MSPRPGTPEYFAQQPTRRTLFLRTFAPWQLARFALINARMLGMIGKERRATRRRGDA